MRPLKIGIIPQELIRERAIAIARGQYKPQKGEPKIWFSSMKSLAEVLSDDNQALLKVIFDQKPASISKLADITGRRQSNLSRTLNKMASIGIVEMKKDNRLVRPIAKATDFQIETAWKFKLEESMHMA